MVEYLNNGPSWLSIGLFSSPRKATPVANRAVAILAGSQLHQRAIYPMDSNCMQTSTLSGVIFGA